MLLLLDALKMRKNECLQCGGASWDEHLAGYLPDFYFENSVNITGIEKLKNNSGVNLVGTN